MQELKQKRNILLAGPRRLDVHQWLYSLRAAEVDQIEVASRDKVEMKSGAVVRAVSMFKGDVPDAFMRLAGISFDTLYILPETDSEVFQMLLRKLRSADKSLTPMVRWVGRTYTKE